MTAAASRARRLYPGAPHFQGAYVKGAQAAGAGRPVDSCPYGRDRAKTWRSAWRSAWIRGWESVAAPSEEEM